MNSRYLNVIAISSLAMLTLSCVTREYNSGDKSNESAVASTSEKWYEVKFDNNSKTLFGSPMLPSNVSVRVSFQEGSRVPTLGLEMGATVARNVFIEVFGLGDNCGRILFDNISSLVYHGQNSRERISLPLKFETASKKCWGELAEGTYVDHKNPNFNGKVAGKNYAVFLKSTETFEQKLSLSAGHIDYIFGFNLLKAIK